MDESTNTAMAAADRMVKRYGRAGALEVATDHAFSHERDSYYRKYWLSVYDLIVEHYDAKDEYHG